MQVVKYNDKEYKIPFDVNLTLDPQDKQQTKHRIEITQHGGNHQSLGLHAVNPSKQ